MKNIKKFSILAILTFFIITVTACGNKKTVSDDTYDKETINTEASQENKDSYNEEDTETTEPIDVSVTTYPLSVKDAFGDQVEIAEEPMTVVSISPEITETIYALDASDKLIGRTDYCNYPEEAANIDSIGSLFEVNVEKVVELNPDLVLVSSLVDQNVVTTLRDQGITALCLKWDESFDGVYDYIGTVGMVLNKKEMAEEVVSTMAETVALVQSKVTGLEKPSAYYVVGFGDWGDSAATGDTFIGEMIEMAGATNSAADGTDWKYSKEMLVEKDPYIVICSNKYDMKTSIETTEGYKDLTAVLEGRLYEVDEDIFSRQGPRIADGLLVLAKIFHPEAFE